MSRKLTEEEAIEQDKKCGWNRLELYKGNKTKVDYKCPLCNNIFKISPQAIWSQKQKSCRQCYHKTNAINRLITEEEATEKDKEMGWTRLEKYIGNNHLVKYICPMCLSIIKITPHRVWGGQSSCEQCSYKNRAKKQRKGTLAKNGIKICSMCLEEKNIKDFYKNKKTKDGYSIYCKECDRFKTISYRYKLSKEEYNKKIWQQNSCCEICKIKFNEKNTAAIDHCKINNKTRGILCHTCNSGIGLMYHDISILKSAIEYLEKHNAQPTHPDVQL